MTPSTELLGEITVPSGVLVVIDCGLLGMWRHDRAPDMPDGVLDPGTTESVNAGTDFEVVGRDAEEAGRAFGRQWHPRFVYDVPRHAVEEMVERFAATAARAGLSAELRPLPGRVPHRTRVDQALEFGAGAGQVFFHGLTSGAVSGLPGDHPLPVHGVRVHEGEFAGCWDHVEVRLRPRFTATRFERVGHVAVDWARVMFADADALGTWKHDEPRDGLADYVFWGLHATDVARAVGAPALGDDHFGWLDLPVQRAAELGLEVERVKAQGGFRMAGDFRPHSDHHAILAQMRASSTESGTVDVGGARLCAFFTTWGDGFFPVLRVLEGEDLVAVRVQLATEETRAAMRAVNR